MRPRMLSPQDKGYPHGAPPLPVHEVGQQGWNVLDGDLPFPIATLRQGRLQHNLAWMQRFAADRGLHLAPHGKTTLSPELFQRQLAAGAWGITVANPTQARLAAQAGAAVVLIANQVLLPGDLAALAELRWRHPGLRLLFLLDAEAQLRLIEAWWQQAAPPTLPFDVLLEVGTPGGRTGVRSTDAGLLLARAAHASQAVRLCGVECFEGLSATADSAKDQAFAAPFMARLAGMAQAINAEQLWDCTGEAGDEVVLSAGGSGVFDLVVPALQTRLRLPVRGLLRSGCYVTHDQGSYQRLGQSMAQRLGCEPGLQAALEVWAVVQSLPEPGLAILSCGKRDISHDQMMPPVLRLCRLGSRRSEPVPAHWRVSTLNDQHAYLRTQDGAHAVGPEPQPPLQLGDRICLGVSHPCTTFDKWRWMPLVDDDGNVVDAITTWF